MLLYNYILFYNHYRIRKSKLEAWVSAFGESAQGTDPYIAYQTSKYHSLPSAAFHHYHVQLFELRRRRIEKALAWKETT